MEFLVTGVGNCAIRTGYPLFRLVEKFEAQLIELLKHKAASQANR